MTKLLKYLTIGLRVLMGALFVFAGLNGFFNFVPPPKEPMPEFITAMINTGYMMKLVAGTQLAAGLLLLVGRFVPLALVIIAPVIVNIFLFHTFLAPEGEIVAMVLVTVELFLVWSYRGYYKQLFTFNAKPEA